MEHNCAGLLVIWREHILLVEQKIDKGQSRLSIPKGTIEGKEDILDCAIRETYEETGLVVKKEDIDTTQYLMNFRNSKFQRKIIYFVARLSADTPPPLSPVDKAEIAEARWVDYRTAERLLQVTQLSVLMHLKSDRIPERAARFLVNSGYITCERHFQDNLLIYNYTNLCKSHQYWNEITLWCRGMITGTDNKILYRPMKKFFESSQLFEEFVPKAGTNFDLYEKKDGALGILFWRNNIAHIATRGSFTTDIANIGNIILYDKYSQIIPKLDRACTYFFEIVTPKDRHVVDYGSCEDLFLIGAYNNQTGCSLYSKDLGNLGFPVVRHYPKHGTVEELQAMDIDNEEGYVAVFPDSSRLKIKFNNYKKKHAEIFH